MASVPASSRTRLASLIEQGIDALRAQGTLPADLAAPAFTVERPKDRSHGDFSTNAAMLLAKPAKSNPRAIAQALVAALPPSDDIAAVEIAGPGFLNFRLAPPLMVLTGLTMSPAVDAAWPWLLDLFQGRQSARSIHFICAAALVLFIAVHLIMVVLAGPINEVRSMITGRFRVPPDRGTA